MPETIDCPDAAVRERGLQMPASSRGLVIVVHPDRASRRHSGHCFVADVLHANGLATLAIDLHTAEEQLRGVPAPGMVRMKHRIRAVFDWLSTQAALGDRPVALLGIDGAVHGCIAAAARRKPAALRSLVLLDGGSYHAAHLLSRLSLPTLFVIGKCSASTAARHRAAVRQMSAASRLEVLALPTQPVAASGAHQAFALAAMGWFAQTLWPQEPAPHKPWIGQPGPAGLRADAQSSAGAGR